ncbi:serine/threonine protein kinase [Slackia heliotrinireducens]|uniref:Protein kinase family protein n=1 Tax=Slackia heliotrinireducens (strain ATCC 29202 / DSM 20476 / NCTC 11029 / RHS 1) TaxID=471855 RepID=C7N2F7_SLAHD|nr:serine/threonine-protein kinase [Slackia heliotrinireducens]ACV21463.1 protein kinase family protein [Slackia heliotrinireducens DSM 20476]VEG98902.1 Uncharacterized protein with protein kinase and helix-hairpin-helix DNA-binding domains [Slackia heliotrinireducens]
MPQFKPGDVVQTVTGMPVTVKKYLAAGGQGEVYIADFNGEDKALKWYKRNVLPNPDKFYTNLKNNAAKGAPDPSFLWPITVTEREYGSFGYVMDLRDPEYHELTEFLVADVKFVSFKAAVEACIRIASAFRILHNNGMCYQDMNDGNFFINPKTGKVLICDNDNAAPNLSDTFILGTPGYMAPEVVLGQAQPSTSTDRFSLAVVLYMILCNEHPLEGRRWTKACLTPADERKLYGSMPLFVYDPDNDDNRPVPGVHNNEIMRWKFMPSYVQDAFIKALSQDALKNPGKRMRELDWLKVLVRFQGDIVSCPSCGGEVFVTDASDTPCDTCQQMLQVTHTLKLLDYSVTAARKTRVYRCQIDPSCNADSALDQVVRVVSRKDKPGVLGLMNATDNVILGITPSGKVNQVKPGDVVPLKAGIRLQVYDAEIGIQ